MIISYAKYIGHSITEPSKEFIQIIKEYGIQKPLEINRDGVMMVTGTNGGLAMIMEKVE